MVQTYPKYESDLVIGTIASHKCNACVTKDGKYVFVGGLENVLMWNIRKEQIERKFYDPDSNSSVLTTEASFVQLNPDETDLAVGYSNGSVRVFSISSGEMKVHFSGHDSLITSLKYDPNGMRLASTSRDNDIVIWDISNECGECRLKGHSDIVNDCLFLDEDGSFLASCSKDSLIKIWDISIQHCVETIVGQKNEILSLALSSQRDRLVALTVDSEVRVYKVNAKMFGKQLEDENAKSLSFHFSFNRQSKERPSSVVFHEELPFLFIQNTSDKTVEIYKIRSEEDLQRKANRRKKRLEKSDSNQTSSIAKPSDELVFMKSIRFSHKLRTFDFMPVEKNSSFISVLAVLTNNSYEICQFNIADSNSSDDKIVKVNDLTGHRNAVKKVVMSHNQDLICSLSIDTIKLWNIRSGSLVRTIDCKQVSVTEFLPHDRELLVGTKTGELEIYDIASGSLVESIKAHSGNITSIALRNDHKSFASGSVDKEVKFWDFELVPVESDLPSSIGCNGKRLSFALSDTLSLSEEVTCLKFSPDSKLIAIGQLDFTVKVFFVDSLKFYLSLYGHKLPCFSIDISADSKFLISASHDKNVKIWGLDFGDCHRSIFAHQDAVTSVHFIGEKKLFVSTGKDRQIKIWDAENFQQVSRLSAHHDEVWDACCTLDGEYLFSVSNDRTIRRWIIGDEPLFLAEEREKELEEMHDQQLKLSSLNKEESPEKVTVESLKHCDKVIEAVENCMEESELWKFYNEQRAKNLSVVEPPLNPIFQGRNGDRISPSDYLLRVFERIPTSELRSVILVLPFNIVLGILEYLESWFHKCLNLNLCFNVLTPLLKIHAKTLSTSKNVRPILERIQELSRKNLAQVQDVFLLNNAALNYLQKSWETEYCAKFFNEDRIAELQLRTKKRIYKRQLKHN